MVETIFCSPNYGPIKFGNQSFVRMDVGKRALGGRIFVPNTKQTKTKLWAFRLRQGKTHKNNYTLFESRMLMAFLLRVYQNRFTIH